MIAAVLANGAARRLGGANKPLVRVGGAPMVDRVVAAAAACVGRVVIVTNSPELFEHFRPARGVEVVADAVADAGPLGGLFTALSTAEAEGVLLLGSDLPHLTPAGLKRVLHAAGDAQAAVPVIGGRPQPLCAAYAPSVLGAVAAQLAGPSRRMHDLLAAVGVRWLDEAALAYTPADRWLDDVDTWEDVAGAAGGGPGAV